MRCKPFLSQVAGVEWSTWNSVPQSTCHLATPLFSNATTTSRKTICTRLSGFTTRRRFGSTWRGGCHLSGTIAFPDQSLTWVLLCSVLVDGFTRSIQCPLTLNRRLYKNINFLYVQVLGPPSRSRRFKSPSKIWSPVNVCLDKITWLSHRSLVSGIFSNELFEE